MKLIYNALTYCGMICGLFVGCDKSVEERKMQHKIEAGFDGQISEESIAKGFKGDNTIQELKNIEKNIKEYKEKIEQSVK